MQVIRFAARILFAILQLTVTLLLATGFVVFIVPGILVRHLLDQPKPTQPTPVGVLPTLVAEPTF